MRTALVSTFPPRSCGIGTFANALSDSLLRVDGVDAVDRVAIVNNPEQADSQGFAALIAQPVRGDYLRAARVLEQLDVDVVLLQHEYGIFGGRDGEYVLSFVEEIAQPLVVTLHTVLSKPTPNQARVLTDVCAHARLVTVMTETARELAVAGGICDEDKLRVVAHGAPRFLSKQPEAPPFGRYRRIEGRFIISTFGLLSGGKGIEVVLAALPSIVKRHPEVLYVVAGQTHPEVARREGEKYRSRLEQLVVEYELDDHVIFDDRFLDDLELADLLGATQVFATPYRQREQISSGALTFGLAAGCAVVSTPYRYAEDMLASGAGLLVPFDDASATATAILRLIEEPSLLSATRAEARQVSSTLEWPAVAKATAAVLGEAMEPSLRRERLPVSKWHYNRARIDHLLTLIDDVGIIQHADGVIPNRRSGYCVDDVARLVPVALELARRKDQQTWTVIVFRALAFLADAVRPEGMHNLMGYDRRWLDTPHAGDHVGRTMDALTEILDGPVVSAAIEPAERLLSQLIDEFPPTSSARMSAFGTIALARQEPGQRTTAADALLEELVSRLRACYTHNAVPGWQWFEQELTYDNARLSQALLAGGVAINDDFATEAGLESLRWLGDECGLERRLLRLPGNRWRRHREPAPGKGDEQPLDACALVEAELAAYRLTGNRDHCSRAQIAFDWFLGRNHLQQPVYDFASGGCSDRIGPERMNGNQGAESTLAFHRAALAIDTAGLPAAPHPPQIPAASPA